MCRPVANGNIDTTRRCTVRYDCIWLGQAALVKMELTARDIANSKVRRIDRGKITTQGLEDDQFKTVVVGMAAGCYSVPCIVPPFGQVAVRSFVLRKTHRWQRDCLRRSFYCRQLRVCRDDARNS